MADTSALDLDALLLTCEHGGNRVPAAYADLFARRRTELASHRGFDRGALALARALARRTRRPLLASTVTRLLVDLNRSPGHPALFSEVTRTLPAAERERILATHYRPHRRAVESAIEAAVQRRGRACHVAVHSFAPRFRGRRRQADVGLLYDPRREAERRLCSRWQALLRELDPALHVRRNYPYRGATDGLTTALRRRFGARAYLGLEVEVNQRLLADRRRRRRIVRILGDSLERLARS